MRLLCLAAALALPTMAASEIVRFDVDAHCKGIAGFGGTYSHEMYAFCIESEQAAYKSLKPRWTEISSTIREHCIQIASFGGPGSYEMLQFCIREEENAEASAPSFKY